MKSSIIKENLDISGFSKVSRNQAKHNIRHSTEIPRKIRRLSADNPVDTLGGDSVNQISVIGDNETICFLCQGKGLISWSEIRWGYSYQFMARCDCRAGDSFSGLPLAKDVLSPFELQEMAAAKTKTEFREVYI